MELPAHPELAPAWRTIRDELRRAVGESTYDMWFAALEPKGWDGAVLLLDGPEATRAWVAERFGRVLERCAQAVLGAGARVAIAGDPAAASRAALSAGAGGSAPDTATRINPRYRFDQFIIGDGNRLAHAAALAVAEAPGQAYNPLFLYAPPGLGKTHLLHAIANYVQAFEPDTNVRYTTVEAFTNGFIAAITGKEGLEHFKHLYRDVDVLLIDDVQFLASKAKTEEEFFHTFNALYDSGRQLVLTCDRLPRQLVGIEERLRERFESGLVAELLPPDRATRLAILRKRAELDRLDVADPLVLDLIADRIVDNIRSLEGALIRIVAHHSLTGRPLDLQLATTVLDAMHPRPEGSAPASEAGSRTHLTIARIQAEVSTYFGLTPEELCASTRTARVAWPRQVAIHLARDLTGASLQAIGQAFGGRNHATVVHACRRVSDRITAHPEDAAAVEAIGARLTGPHNDRRD